MKSPFPGMDPYLERYWRGVHHALITYARDQLRPSLPTDLHPRIEERVFIETYDDDEHEIYPDVHVVERPSKQAPPQDSGGIGIVAAEPIIVHVEREPASQGYIEIVDAASGNRVVTVVEFVSPTNKRPGKGRTLYRRKQKDVIAAGASLVEIDLTRAGKRSFAGPVSLLRPKDRATYMACITRGWKPHLAEFYPLRLAEALPALRIPLRESDSDVVLNLQALIDQCYENGDYDIDYHQPPKPPFDPAAAAWAEKWLQAKGVMP